MTYKIIKCETKNLQTFLYDNGNGKSYNKIEIEHSVWYEARRKGTIFGFWHKVGHQHDYDGNIISYTAKNLEDIEEYIRKWHEVEYFDKPIKIIKTFNL